MNVLIFIGDFLCKEQAYCLFCAQQPNNKLMAYW